MKRVYSNGGTGDFVSGPYMKLVHTSSTVFLAAPYFNRVDEIETASKAGKTVQLLIGLNSATSPDAVAKSFALQNVHVRYLTHRFHAKLYLFDDAAMIGSANITTAGLQENREGVFCFDRPEDIQAIDEIRVLFAELWEAGRPIDQPQIDAFRAAYNQVKNPAPSPDDMIEDAVGRAEPPNIHDKSRVKSKAQLFIEPIRRDILERYRPYFNEIGRVLSDDGFLRQEFEEVGLIHQTNRFLNWVRLTHAPGDDIWRQAERLDQKARAAKIAALGPEWATTSDTKVPPEYFPWLNTVQGTFGNLSTIETCPADQLVDGLLCLHAFNEQQRFVSGGLKNLPKAFWTSNNNNEEKVRRTLANLIHGDGDFVVRLHDTLYDQSRKLNYFAWFCALELFGTVKPDICPPMTGRMAKGMRYLGFEVKAS